MIRTPLDAMHQALVNLAEQKRRAERRAELARRPKPTMAPPIVGTRVVFTHSGPANLGSSTNGLHGVITGTDGGDRVVVLLDDILYGEEPWDSVTTHIVHLQMEDPPPTDINDIERWLNT